MRLKKRNHEKGLAEFLDHLRKLSITIPFTDALANIPSYAKYLKDLLANKNKVNLKNVMTTEAVNVMMHGELPPKLKDQGAFNIPCRIGINFEGQALCDLGASINLMPLSTFKKLGLGEMKRTVMKIMLADCSVMSPCGIIEDILVRVDGLIIPTDFIICEMEEDKDVPLILGRPFLATGRAIIDVHKGEVTFRVKGKEVTFNVHTGMKCLSDEKCCAINGVEQSLEPGITFPDFYADVPFLSARDAEKKTDDKKILVHEQPSVEVPRPPEFKSVLNDFNDEFLDSTDILPFSISTGDKCEKEKPHVEKKRKIGIGVKKEKVDLDDKVEPYIPPHRRLSISTKKEVGGKEVIK